MRSMKWRSPMWICSLVITVGTGTTRAKSVSDPSKSLDIVRMVRAPSRAMTTWEAWLKSSAPALPT